MQPINFWRFWRIFENLYFKVVPQIKRIENFFTTTVVKLSMTCGSAFRHNCGRLLNENLCIQYIVAKFIRLSRKMLSPGQNRQKELILWLWSKT